MTLVKDIRKTVTDSTPVFAAVGATDLAVEKVRDARDRVMATHLDLDVSGLQNKAIKRAEKAREQAQQMPALALNQTLEAAGKAQQTYAELAVRGHKLVKRLRNQKSTKDLFAQADSTISIGKGAVTTVRKAAVDTQRAAEAMLTTGVHEAEVVIEAVVSTVNREAKTATGTVRKATTGTVRKAKKATRPASKRTVATAKKSTTSTRRATKSATKSTPKTAAAATAAPKTVTPVVEAPKTVTPAAEIPKTVTPAAEAPKPTAPKTATPKVGD